MLKFWYTIILRKNPDEYNFNCFLITADFNCIDYDSGSQEHTGFTKKIKASLDDHKLEIKNQMNLLKYEIEQTVRTHSQETALNLKTEQANTKKMIQNQLDNMLQQMKSTLEESKL